MNQNRYHIPAINQDDLDLDAGLLQAHIRNLPLGVIEWDNQLTITRWSGEAERIFGWSSRQALGKTIDDFPLFHPQDFTKARETMNRLQGARYVVSAFRNCTRDGGTIHCQWFNSIVSDESGNPLSVLSLVQDVTKQFKAENERELLLGRELKLRTDAENANRMKDQFLATLSHELRSPLNVILAWARILRTAAPDEETLARAIDAIDRSAQLQNRLIADILDVSRIVSGKMYIEHNPVNLISVIRAAIDNIRLLADLKGISIEAILNDSTPQILGDQNRLQQVFWNLFSNAVKFTPPNGRIEIRLYRVGDCAIISVQDNGEGIEADFLPYVFERFSQADGKRNSKHGGLGIGLAIVRHVVLLHGGTVQVLSDGPGRGATFVLKLPLSHQPGTSNAPQ